MVNTIAAVLCGCIMGVARPAPPPLLVVQIDLRIAPSVGSSGIRKIAFEEAKAIWREYGVAVTRPTDPAPSGLRIVVTVAGHGRRDRIPGGQETRVLGRTWLDDASGEPSRVWISFDDVEWCLAGESFDSSLMRELMMARAVGRVLAHEVGHVLLGTHHDADGLMRPTLPSSDLARAERSRFRLSANSLALLRDRARPVADTR